MRSKQYFSRTKNNPHEKSTEPTCDSEQEEFHISNTSKVCPYFPDFITFLRHHIAHIENQLITPNNWAVLGGASEKHVPL